MKIWTEMSALMSIYLSIYYRSIYPSIIYSSIIYLSIYLSMLALTRVIGMRTICPRSPHYDRAFFSICIRHSLIDSLLTWRDISLMQSTHVQYLIYLPLSLSLYIYMLLLSRIRLSHFV